jgi:peptide/nickel transport system substrate-binding protein
LAAGGAAVSLVAACGPSTQPAAPTQAPAATKPPTAAAPTTAPAPTAAPAVKPTAAPAPTTPPKPGAVVQIGRRSEINPLWNPLKTAGGEVQIFDLIFNRLIAPDETWVMQPDLAEKFEVSTDATVYTFNLRKNVKWTDGQPFTARDVIFNYKLNLTKAAGSRQAPRLLQIKGANEFYEGNAKDVSGLEMLDDYTVRISLAQPNVSWVYQLSHSSPILYILPEHILKDVDPTQLDNHAFIKKPDVGTGPYQFVQFVADQFVEFKANPNYFKGAPKIEKVFVTLAEPPTQLAQFERGELDVMYKMTAKDAERLKGNSSLNIVPLQGLGVFQIAWNNERFPDKRVRQAFMYAVDHESLIKVVLRGQGRLVHSTVIGPEWANYPDLNPYKYDPAKAKELLTAAEWDSSRTVNVTWSKGFADIELAAPIVQQQLKEVGFNVNLAPLDSPAYIQKVVSEPDFDMAWFSGGVYALDPDISSAYYECANWTPRGANTTHYCHKELDQFFLQGRSTTDTAKRKEVYSNVARILNEDVPTVFWWSENIIYGVNKRIKGYKVGTNDYLWWNIHEWTVGG